MKGQYWEKIQADLDQGEIKNPVSPMSDLGS